MNTKNAKNAKNANTNEIDAALSGEVKTPRTRSFSPSYTVFPHRGGEAVTGDTLMKFMHFPTDEDLFASVETCPALDVAGLTPDTAKVLTAHLRGLIQDNLKAGNAWKGDESCEFRLVTSRLVCTFARNRSSTGEDLFSLDLSHKEDNARLGDRVLIDGKPPRAALGNFIL